MGFSGIAVRRLRATAVDFDLGTTGLPSRGVVVAAVDAAAVEVLASLLVFLLGDDLDLDLSS